MFHQYLNQLMCKDGRWGQGVKTPQWWIGVKLGSRLISAHCRQIWGCMGPANDAIFGPWCMISHHRWSRSPQSWNSNLVNWGLACFIVWHIVGCMGLARTSLSKCFLICPNLPKCKVKMWPGGRLRWWGGLHHPLPGALKKKEFAEWYFIFDKSGWNQETKEHGA